MIDGMATDEESIDDAMFEDASLHREDGAVQTVFGLDVLPAWRGKGVAGALMQAFTDAARQAGRRKVTLTCQGASDWHVRAFRVYAHRQGAERSRRRGVV